MYYVAYRYGCVDWKYSPVFDTEEEAKSYSKGVLDSSEPSLILLIHCSNKSRYSPLQIGCYWDSKKPNFPRKPILVKFSTPHNPDINDSLGYCLGGLFHYDW